MRYIVAAMTLLGVLGFGAAAETALLAGEVCTIKVEGMACGACAARVEREARKIDGVTAAKVSQPKGTAEITYDPAKTSPEEIARLITKTTGFVAEAPRR